MSAWVNDFHPAAQAEQRERRGANAVGMYLSMARQNGDQNALTDEQEIEQTLAKTKDIRAKYETLQKELENLEKADICTQEQATEYLASVKVIKNIRKMDAPSNMLKSVSLLESKVSELELLVESDRISKQTAETNRDEAIRKQE